MKADIWKIIANIGIELHPDRVDSIAAQIAAITSVNEFPKVKAGFNFIANKELLNELGIAWKEKPELSPIELAAGLRGSSKAAALIEKKEALELVWTGPSTGLVASRHTEQVLLEVIRSSKSKLFIVSFVAYDFDIIKKALHKAVSREVEINILLESSKKHGGKVDVDSIKDFKSSVPQANVYIWNPNSKATGSWNGAVHAKCAVADGKLAFITSANLTKAAMEKNMELGILIKGGSVPKQLENHLESLKTTGVILKI